MPVLLFQMTGADIEVPAYIDDGVLTCKRRFNQILLVANGTTHVFRSASSAPAGVTQNGTVTVSTVDGIKSVSDFTVS